MINKTTLLLFIVLALPPGIATAADSLKAIYLTSPGVYHDYAYQTDAITNALASGMHIQFDVSLEELERWKSTDFGKGYDLIIYNICAADITDSDLIANMRRQTEVLAIPAMVIHCTMHSFRNTEEWWPLYGLKTVAHEAIGEMPLEHSIQHPVLAGIPKDWTVAHDELYINLAFEAQALLTAPGIDSKNHVAAWTYQAGGTRIFGTTLGHSTETIDDPHFQRLLSNATLWITDNLQADGTPIAAVLPAGNSEVIRTVSKAEGIDYLNEDSRSCLRKEIAWAIGPCYVGCVLNPFAWGADAQACKESCLDAFPSTEELKNACQPAG
jgi:uncharacterized protein